MTIVSPFANVSGVPAIQPGAVTRHWGIVQAINNTTKTITVLVDGVTLSGVPVRSGYGPSLGDIAILDVIGTGDISHSYVTAVGVLSGSLGNQVAQAFGSGLTTSSAPGDAVSDGVSLDPARGDHKHGRETRPTFRVWRTASYGAINSVLTVFPFDTVAWDTANGFTTGAGAKYTVPTAGYYQINGGLTHGSPNRLVVCIYKNGSEVARGNDITASGGITAVVADVVHCAANDTLQIVYYDTTINGFQVGAVNWCYMSGVLVAP
jgi:hypothetical protein